MLIGPHVALALLASPLDDPQDAAPPPLVGETVVTASRVDEPWLDAPYAVDVIDPDRLRERAYRTIPQAIRDTPGVLVQETSFGQGSPYVRGWTGFRNLFLIDGIRLNNSVFRDGPNQYWNTVDGQSVGRIELLKGPAAVVHGSDAIGGTLQVLTRDPSAEGFGGRAYWRVASAEESHLGRIEADAAVGEDTGVLVGLTARTFGELRGGRDVGAQPNTGYDEWAADLKVRHRLDEGTTLTFLHQRVQMNDVPRTHQTVFAQPFEGSSVGSDLRRDLDQDRDLTYVQLESRVDGEFADTMKLSLSWHAQSETRDRIRSSMAREEQGFDVGTLGGFANFTKAVDHGTLRYGVDYYRDDVDSFSSTNAIQGPVADDATYDLAGFYLEDAIDVSDATTVTVGARGTWAKADADSVLDPVGGTQVSVNDDWTALTGSVRVLHRVDPDHLHVFGGVSQGFRAPNLSDLTRFDTARTNEYEIPSPGLDPEESVTFELGAKLQGKKTRGEAAVFYSDVSDFIVRFPTGNVDGSGDFEITKDNVGDGYVYGLELAGERTLSDEWSVFANGTLMYGELDTFPTSAPVVESEPIDRLMPPTGQLGVRWNGPQGRAWAEFVLMAAADADELSTRDMGDTSRIPPGGTPGYVVAHVRGGYRVSENSTLNLAVDNLTDEDYRIHGSGTNMPGLNVIFGWTYTW